MQRYYVMMKLKKLQNLWNRKLSGRKMWKQNTLNSCKRNPDQLQSYYTG